MKTIIAGSRGLQNRQRLEEAIRLSSFTISEVVSGGARGIDQLGEQWAKRTETPVRQFLADWDRYGKAAGPIRNAAMARYADALIAIWDGKSRGTLNMIEQAKKYGLKIYISTV